jgi:hypothetical protein
MASDFIFVADTAFISDELKAKFKLINVFPMKNNDGAYRAGLKDLLARSKSQSEFYVEVLPELTKLMKAHMPAAGDEAMRFIRIGLVKTTSIYLDRALRVAHRLKEYSDSSLSFAKVEPYKALYWQSDYNQSWRINQEAIQRIMLSLNYNGIDIFPTDNYPEFPDSHNQKNLLFRPDKPGLQGLLIKLKWKHFYKLDKISNNKSKIQSVGFGADRYYLAKRGLLGSRGLFRAKISLDLIKAEKNCELRNEIYKTIKPFLSNEFQKLFLNFDRTLDEEQSLGLSEGFVQTFIDWFPTCFLEGLESNLNKAAAQLDLNNGKIVIGHEVVSDVGYFVSTAARKNGMKVIGVQHGGHYGYINDMSVSAEFEYSYYDKMITWGWTKIDEHLPKCELVPLPCPKLSEKPLKSNYLKSASEKNIKKADVLFYSNQFHRFPHISTCGQARVDFIDQITDSQEKLVRTLNSEGITVDHKPYSMKFVELYPEHYNRLQTAGGTNYRLLTSVHKGITSDFIKKCRFLLWDQIGSGTLECFTSGVPTIVFWQRIYSEESPYSRELISDLEKNGVIHRSPETLAIEIKKYLANPKSWMENNERKLAIERFCKSYALCDDKWYIKWKEQLAVWSL